jgi:hypothetical protein
MASIESRLGRLEEGERARLDAELDGAAGEYYHTRTRAELVEMIAGGLTEMGYPLTAAEVAARADSPDFRALLLERIRRHSAAQSLAEKRQARDYFCDLLARGARWGE